MSLYEEARYWLEELGVRPSKRLGQNFLIEAFVRDKIISFARVIQDEVILEVGPGLGVLTKELQKKTNALYVVEFDKRLFEKLKENDFGLLKERVMHSDILQFDIESFLKSASPSKRIKLVSNAPYSISSDFIIWIIHNRFSFYEASLLLQREFVERVCAKPDTKDYSSLSVFCQTFAKVEKGPSVNGAAFFPKADVESMLLRILPCEELPKDITSIESFERVVRGCFSKRRKTISNNLLASGLASSREHAEQVLGAAGIDAKARAETLSPSVFIELYKVLKVNS